MNQVRIFACEAQPIVLEGLAKVLAVEEDFTYLGCAQTFPEALDAVRELRPDIVLLDQSGGLRFVFQFISDVKNTYPGCQPVLWVNELGEMDCLRAIQVGARGILRKTVPVSIMIDCLRSVSQGEVWMQSPFDANEDAGDARANTPRLTPREKEIVHQVCAGLKNKEIAQALAITPGTVKVHLMHIFEKTGVKDRFELAVHGRRLLGMARVSRVQPLRSSDPVPSTI